MDEEGERDGTDSRNTHIVLVAKRLKTFSDTFAECLLSARCYKLTLGLTVTMNTGDAPAL